jgi:uncharacterized damage-inducible protein DinB
MLLVSACKPNHLIAGYQSMIDVACVQCMARYNQWQNQNVYGAADQLSAQERRRERGAFFGSIEKTLSHLLWADRIWMSHFGAAPRPPGGIPESALLYSDWETLKLERSAFDAKIIGWSDQVGRDWLESDLTWFSNAAKTEMTRPRWLLVVHMFNHQAHHRGQVHCLITQSGGKLHDTDLALM